MKVVLDASAAYDLLTERNTGERLAGASDVLAPDLIVSELLNVRWKVLRARRPAPSREVTIAFLQRLRLVASLAYAEEAAILADQLDESVYDALYVAIARAQRARLLTLDQRLLTKLRASPGLARLPL